MALLGHNELRFDNLIYLNPDLIYHDMTYNTAMLKVENTSMG